MYKTLWEHIEVNLRDLRSDNGFLDMVTKAQVTKEKSREIELHKNF